MIYFQNSSKTFIMKLMGYSRKDAVTLVVLTKNVFKMVLKFSTLLVVGFLLDIIVYAIFTV